MPENVTTLTEVKMKSYVQIGKNLSFLWNRIESNPALEQFEYQLGIQSVKYVSAASSD